MQNEEQLLSNYHVILGLRNAGFSIKQITQDLNQHFNIPTTYRQLRYLIDRVTNHTIHKEYNHIAVIDGLKDAYDPKLNDYCVDFKGLLITFKTAANSTNTEYIITHKNITTIYSQHGLLYAKRLLKLYHISDRELLKQHKLIYPIHPDIDIQNVVENININFNNEFANMMIELRDKYMKFISYVIRNKYT